MIPCILRSVFLPLGWHYCSLCLQTLPTDEVWLQISAPAERDGDQGPVSLPAGEAVPIAYDELRQQHFWRGLIPSERDVIIRVERSGDTVGRAVLHSSREQLTCNQEQCLDTDLSIEYYSWETPGLASAFLSRDDVLFIDIAEVSSDGAQYPHDAAVEQERDTVITDLMASFEHIWTDHWSTYAMRRDTGLDTFLWHAVHEVFRQERARPDN